MAVVVERPTSGYTSTTTTTNATKYETDSGLMTAISSAKVDGDINKLIDGINTVASYDGGLGNTSLSTTLTSLVTDTTANTAGLVTVNALTGGGTGQTTLANTLTDFESRVSTNETDIASLVSGTIPDGDKGDITVSSSGSVWTIDDNAITTSKLASNSVTTAKITNDSVTTDKILNGNVTTAKIADDAITSDKLNNTGVTAGSYTVSNITVDAQGRITSASSGTSVSDASETVAGVVELATDAEVAAGTETGGTGATLSVNPSQLTIRGYYKSANQTLTPGGALTLAHGLGQEPKMVEVLLYCATANNGYSVGDEVLVAKNATNGNNVRAAAITYDATNIYVRYASAAPLWQISTKNTGARVDLTSSQWRLVIKAIA